MLFSPQTKVIFAYFNNSVLAFHQILLKPYKLNKSFNPLNFHEIHILKKPPFARPKYFYLQAHSKVFTSHIHSLTHTAKNFNRSTSSKRAHTHILLTLEPSFSTRFSFPSVSFRPYTFQSLLP